MIRDRSNNGVNSSQISVGRGVVGASGTDTPRLRTHWQRAMAKALGRAPHTPTFLDRSRSTRSGSVVVVAVAVVVVVVQGQPAPRMLARVESSALSRCRIKASAAHCRARQPVAGRRCETCELCRLPLFTGRLRFPLHSIATSRAAIG
jgi:hypothetical protein